jgi:mRNA interferase RelE/StbE
LGASAKRFEADLIKYQIIILPAAEKSLSKLPKKMQLRIQGAITTLASNPLPPVAKKLVGRDTYRLRVSDYRIIYSIEKNILTVKIISVDHRREAYRKD